MQAFRDQLIGGRYLVEGHSSSHGPVELYDALDPQLDRQVRLQIVTEEAANEPQVADTFLAHQRIASAMYDCALAVYDAGTWQGRPYSVMEKSSGLAPSALHRPGDSPDVAAVLRVMRQTADSLHCCRDAGLSDWTFSPEAVSIDVEGNARLAIIEGLSGDGSSSCAADDPAALGALLRVMLTGRPDASDREVRAGFIPWPLLALLDRLTPGTVGGIAGTTDLAAEIAALEKASLQPTQAYEAGGVVQSASVLGIGVAAASYSHLDPSEAPTVAGYALPDALPAAPEQEEHPRRVAALPLPHSRLLVVAGGFVLAIAVLAIFWPRASGAEAQVQGSSAKNAVGTVVESATTATPQPIIVSLEPTPTVAPIVAPAEPTSTQPPAPPVVEQAPPVQVADPPETKKGDENKKDGGRGREDKDNKDDDDDDDD